MSSTGSRKRRRQDIVSCKFCREKKLKCDRQDPCSNCTARHIPCTAATSDSPAPSPNPDRTKPIQPYPTPAPASERDRSWILNGRTSNGDNTVHIPTPGASWNTSQRSDFSRDRPRSPDAEQDDYISRTAIQLETTATDVGVSSAGALCGDNPSIPQPKLTLLVPLGEPVRLPLLTALEVRECLPTVAQALRLFHHYSDTLNWVCPILHLPTTRMQIRAVYEKLEHFEPLDYAQIALLGTVLGCGAHFWTPDIGMDSPAAANLAYRLTSLAQHALVNAKYAETPTVATIQAVILLSTFLLRDARGPSTSSPIMGLVWSWARKSAWHMLDSPAEVKQRHSRRVDHVDLEVKRRLMCYISSTDWLIAAMHGPCSGTYLIHPQHLHVNLPSNVDDDALDVDGAYARPATILTDTTYFLLRHQLAAVCRDAVDAASSAGITIDQLGYNKLMQLDREFERIYQNIPTCFLLDEESRRSSKVIEKDWPYVVWQRSMIHLGYNSKRSQLHRPFLGRGLRDSRYAYSRQICIDCAHVVLKVEQDLRTAAKGVSPRILQIWTVVHHLFLAGLVLALDFRFNDNDLKRKQEVVQCCEALEIRQGESVIAAKGAQQLRKILDGASLSTLIAPGITRQSHSRLPGDTVASQGMTTPTSAPVPNATALVNPQAGRSQDQLPDFTFTNDFNDFDIDTFGFPDDLVTSWEEIFKDLTTPPES